MACVDQHTCESQVLFTALRCFPTIHWAKSYFQLLFVHAEEARDDCYPARVHATLDLLDRHLATMKDQLTPKPLPGRAPPKKVVCSQEILFCHLQHEALHAVLVQSCLGLCYDCSKLTSAYGHLLLPFAWQRIMTCALFEQLRLQELQLTAIALIRLLTFAKRAGDCLQLSRVSFLAVSLLTGLNCSLLLLYAGCIQG